METETGRQANRLTPRQLQLLRAITSFKAKQCYSPTIGELAGQLRISRTTAFEHIGELRKKAMLLGLEGKARSLEVTSKARRVLDRLDDADTSDRQTQGGTSIPLAGSVAAGTPIEAIEEKEELHINSYFGVDEGTFALKVKGDSMIDDGICDGDYVICRKSCVAHEGQLVIAIVDDENATLKRFYREKGCVRLQPANDNYKPIYSSNCRIEAVVVGLTRKF